MKHLNLILLCILVTILNACGGADSDDSNTTESGYTHRVVNIVTTTGKTTYSTTYSYDAKGNHTEFQTKKNDEPYSKGTLVYDKSGKLEKIDFIEGDTNGEQLFFYDDQDRLKRLEYTSYVAKVQLFKIIQEYNYKIVGIIEVDNIDPYSKQITSKNLQYFNKDNLVEKIEHILSESVVAYTHEYSYSFDVNNVLIKKEVDYNGDGIANSVSEYTYEAGKCVLPPPSFTSGEFCY
ncbi:MAG: hypothetical protein OEY52_02910 [Gammaproteobacteria bacterium]|nr:hypothetical protein [Gammaproteobacteria bacterium]